MTAADDFVVPNWDFDFDWEVTERVKIPETTHFGLRSSRRDMGFTALGVYSIRSMDSTPFYAWKKDPAADVTTVMAKELAALIENWFPVRGVDWVVTTPPQGASKHKTAGGVYPAGMLGAATAALLGLDYVTTLTRQADKKWHSRHQTMAQGDFLVAVRPPSMAVVIDDMLTSGTTMGLSVKALRGVGVPTVQFVWVGI